MNELWYVISVTYLKKRYCTNKCYKTLHVSMSDPKSKHIKHFKVTYINIRIKVTH
jgi:hypothetical protein